MRTLVISSVVAIFVATSSWASTLSYDEATDGELGFLDTTFTLDMAGTNTITGSGSRVPSSFDNDSFFLNLASGISIDAIAFSIANGTSRGSGTYTPGYSVQELDTGSFLSSFSADLSTNTVSSVGSVVAAPYAFSSYRIWFGGSSFNGGVDAAIWDWDISIETSVVSAVPVPASLPLLLAGLGIFGLARKRRSGN
ncbi:VPLPA-CTERM sorting domain-containing protein [Tateyamaria sp.]|uniref:VPLPA-CTERM sorting domain-containing protein n=1 Tax=Tateyamaria sp. TaxID=1929288 RepID=UPI00329A9094